MEKHLYSAIESFMRECMKDSAHDTEHVYRVLYMALEIAKYEIGVNQTILIAACLLHDIGREEQFRNPSLCHAKVGAQKAYDFLMQNGFEKEDAKQIKACIETHRYRKGNLPESIEAKILFDADKLDVAGAVGIARTLLHQGKVGEPLYTLDPNGEICNGAEDKEESFFQEYKYKLEHLYNRFYTKKAAQIAKARQTAAQEFYAALLKEMQDTYHIGKANLYELFEQGGNHG